MGIDIETLYINMICACGGNLNGAFQALEKRPLSETLWLLKLWEKIHVKPDKTLNSMFEKTSYRVTDNPEIKKALR